MATAGVGEAHPSSASYIGCLPVEVLHAATGAQWPYSPAPGILPASAAPTPLPHPRPYTRAGREASGGLITELGLALAARGGADSPVMAAHTGDRDRAGVPSLQGEEGAGGGRGFGQRGLCVVYLCA